MKLKITAVAIALASLSSVAQADVLVQPSFNDDAYAATLPNVTQTVTVKQAPQPSFQDNSDVAYGVIENGSIYASTEISG
jgi:hypothetical protein